MWQLAFFNHDIASPWSVLLSDESYVIIWRASVAKYFNDWSHFWYLTIFMCGRNNAPLFIVTHNNDCYLIVISDNDRAITAIKPLSKSLFRPWMVDPPSLDFQKKETRKDNFVWWSVLKEWLLHSLEEQSNPATCTDDRSRSPFLCDVKIQWISTL